MDSASPSPLRVTCRKKRQPMTFCYCSLNFRNAERISSTKMSGCGEMAAVLSLVPVDEIRISLLGPTHALDELLGNLLVGTEFGRFQSRKVNGIVTRPLPSLSVP